MESSRTSSRNFLGSVSTSRSNATLWRTRGCSEANSMADLQIARESERADAAGAGLRQCIGARGDGCSSGDHIVDHQHARSIDVLWRWTREGSRHIDQTPRGFQAALSWPLLSCERVGEDHAADCRPDLLGEEHRLVEAALPQPAGCKRHRHDDVRLEWAPSKKFPQELAHEWRQVAARLEFERQHCRARRAVVAEGSADAGQRG